MPTHDFHARSEDLINLRVFGLNLLNTLGHILFALDHSSLHSLGHLGPLCLGLGCPTCWRRGCLSFALRLLLSFGLSGLLNLSGLLPTLGLKMLTGSALWYPTGL